MRFWYCRTRSSQAPASPARQRLTSNSDAMFCSNPTLRRAPLPQAPGKKFAALEPAAGNDGDAPPAKSRYAISPRKVQEEVLSCQYSALSSRQGSLATPRLSSLQSLNTEY